MTSLEDYSRSRRQHHNHHQFDEESESDIYWKLDDESVSKRMKEHNNEDVILEKYAGTGVTIISLIAENLLCHPFLVLRRQCQVHYKSRKNHIVPFTLIPVICHLHKHQGITTLWKGIGSTLLIRSMTLGVEDVISKVTPWPKEISWYSSLKQFLQHACLKCVSLAIITPFYSASLVETVQSDIASEKPGIMDVFREGAARMFTIGGRGRGGRMLPIWALVLPTVTLGIARYLFALAVEGTVLRLIRVRKSRAAQLGGACPKRQRDDPTAMAMNAGLVALVASDIVFYPFECILHRLHLQATKYYLKEKSFSNRFGDATGSTQTEDLYKVLNWLYEQITGGVLAIRMVLLPLLDECASYSQANLSDNLDTGRSVLPILTNYSGAVDCYESCLRNEGVAGLYKGFGALILQHMAHIAVVRITRFVIAELTGLLRKTNPNSTSAVISLQQHQGPSLSHENQVLTPDLKEAAVEQSQPTIVSNMRIISDQTYMLP